MTAIIDAHHHIWRRADLPWLDGPMQPRIFGPYEPIRRDYPIGEYLSDITDCGVTASVYVQANWAKDTFEDEVAYVQRAADETGFPQAIVGYADFLVDDVRLQCDRLTKYRGMRGLRMQLHWHANPQYRFAGEPDLARNATLQRNVARLADYGWTFDLQVFAGQMAGAAELAASAPNVVFILQHAGMLEDTYRGRMGAMARRDASSRRLPKRGVETLRTRHVHPQKRPRSYRGVGARNRRAVRRDTLPVRLEFPGREIVDTVFGSGGGVPPRAQAVRRRDVARGASRHGGESLSAQSHSGEETMALEIKILDYGDIELESSFLVLGRDCGRIRRVPVFGFLVLGGTWPVVVDTGYRSNQIMETLGMRGLQSHETMIENQLKKHGLRLGDVRYVLHTHLHIDHAGKDDLFPMNTAVVINRRELEYSVSGLMHPQYPAVDIKHLVDRLHTKGALRFLDLEISGPVELMPGLICEAAGGHTEGSMNIVVKTNEGVATICGDVIYDINDQLVEPFREIGDMEPRVTGNHGTTKRQEKAAIKKVVASSRFVLPVHDRPALIEAGMVTGRLQDSVPGAVVQSLPRRQWFPA